VEKTILDEVLSIHDSMLLKKSSTRQSLRGDDTTRIVSELIQVHSSVTPTYEFIIC